MKARTMKQAPESLPYCSSAGSSSWHRLLRQATLLAGCAALPAAWAQAATQTAAASEAADAQACIAPSTFVELGANVAGTVKDSEGKESVALGMYERISPDGRYVLRSFSGRKLGDVSLLELPAFEGQVLAGHVTPLSNEAFPVQGTWRYLVSISGQHYRFADVLRQGTQAKPLFKGGMTGFYAVASELPGSRPGEIRIRSVSWPNASGNSDQQGIGALAARTLTVDTARHRITADSGVQYLCRHRVAEDGSMYALPMISVDGQEYAAMPQMPVKGASTMRIFGFGNSDGGCELHETFQHSSGKTIFGFPQRDGSGADVAYEYRGQIWWYSRALKQAFNLAPPPKVAGENLLASAFPGITRDGRVIYASTLRHCDGNNQNCTQKVGYTIADPYQSKAFRAFRQAHPDQTKHLPVCIRRGDVLKERAAFAELHGLPAPQQ
ncbi:MAG: hypothetical protein Q4A28_00410 [Brachymonas sp.]|nr:hypothetical protein [Brachymonas sp.]